MSKKLPQATAALLLFPLVVVGCSFTSDSEKTSTPIDPPPVQVINAEAVAQKNQTEAKQEATQEKQGSAELYFLTDSQYVAPYTVPMTENKDVQAQAKAIVQKLIQDAPDAAKLPNGFTAVIPKGTTVKALKVDNGKATVEFSKEFLSYDVAKEQQIFQAITWSLTSHPQIKEVNLYVEGAPLQAKGKSNTAGLTRSNGINIDLSAGIDITRSMPVTVYYLMQNHDKKVFYVPVTRMVDRSENVAATTIAELIRGPKYGSQLVNVMDSAVTLNKVELKGDTLYADFNEAMLQYQNNSAGNNVLNSIVLSLTENTTAKKVKITVNGNQTIGVSSNGKQAEVPVDRPQYVNPSQL
ncbi:GerMN domain-containing protein [Risungbinella massiliensis]|uniref:GerMN domain-containing protein n=1 Tax=Risungbinella massiliensis TaxID=1329796 RepID=UPI0005CC1D6C|nr:GerMN domain-containing protein [Risungbinella massiliensis]